MSERPTLGPKETSIILAGALLTHFGKMPSETPPPSDPFWDWFRTSMPHTAAAMRESVIHEVVQELLDEKVLAGELIAERVDGQTQYRKVAS